MLGLCSVVKIINSQKRKVDVMKLKELATNVYLRIVKKFPWAVISPSVHRILAHSWERIMMNGGFGLGSESEEGLEALNKLIRKMRETGSRKTDTFSNFEDTYNHLWDRSRPVIVNMEREIRKHSAKLTIRTEIETLVESLFEEDDESE